MKVSSKFKGKAAVYCIQNNLNGKIYIGSTVNLYARLHGHRNELKYNKHQNSYLQNSVNKNGLNNFSCFPIEFIKDTENINYREQYWIDKLDPSFNLTKEVIRNTLSKESRDKVSKTLKRRYKAGEISKTRTTPIDVYNYKGKFVKSFDTIKEASKKFGIHESSIIRVIEGKFKQCKGYVFRRRGDEFGALFKVNKGQKRILAKSNKPSSHNRPVAFEDLDTREILSFSSMKEAASFFKVSSAVIGHVINKSKSGIYKDRYIYLPHYKTP